MVATVLYIDHAKHLTPLALAYHATASRHLTTGRTDVIPPSTLVEVDSAYCPRCLTYCDAASASLGFCQVDLESSSLVSCKECPLCFSPLAVSIDPVKSEGVSDDEQHLTCHYLCGYCKWSSQECGIISNADKLIEYVTDPTDPSREADFEKQRQQVVADVSKQLEYCLRERIQKKNQAGDDIFKSLTNTWAKKEKDEDRRRRLGLALVDDVTNSKGQAWSLDVLEQSLKEKKNNLTSLYTLDATSVGFTSSAIDDEIDNPSNILQSALPTSQQVAAQMAISTTVPSLRSDLLPLPVPFRVRVNRRCLAEQAAGKTGILVKPKLNPLEGDSSLRAGHGQWFKKDSSAVNSVPRVEIYKYGKDSDGCMYAVLFKVHNPTLSMIRFRFSSPALHENSENAADALVEERELQNIPIDPFNQTFVNARICSTKSVDELLAPTEWLVLENAEDLFLDIGNRRKEVPAEVQDWEARALLNSLGDENRSNLHVVAVQRDTAWIQMTLSLESIPESSEEIHVAFPLGLQIEVGNGSWEASLIKKCDLPEDEIDMVTLNIIALLD